MIKACKKVRNGENWKELFSQAEKAQDSIRWPWRWASIFCRLRQTQIYYPLSMLMLAGSRGLGNHNSRGTNIVQKLLKDGSHGVWFLICHTSWPRGWLTPWYGKIFYRNENFCLIFEIISSMVRVCGRFYKALLLEERAVGIRYPVKDGAVWCLGVWWVRQAISLKKNQNSPSPDSLCRDLFLWYHALQLRGIDPFCAVKYRLLM